MNTFDKMVIVGIFVGFMVKCPEMLLAELGGLLNAIWRIGVWIWEASVETLDVEPEPELTMLQRWGFVRLQSMIDRIKIDLDFELTVYFGLMAGLVALMVLYWIICFVVNKGIRKFLYRIRKIEMIEEAMQVGSEFRSAEKGHPKCQLAFMVPGLLSDVHQAYGVRFPGCVVTAKHALSPFVGRELILVGPTGVKVLWKVAFEESRVFPDVAYCIINNNVLAKLGLQIVSVSQSTLSNPIDAEAYGQEGKTVGQARKNPDASGLVIYTGSTVPGMSGGGIFSNGALVGIHMGSMGGYNISACAAWIRSETKQLGFSESLEAVRGSGGSDWDAIKKLMGPKQNKVSWDVNEAPVLKKGAENYMATRVNWAEEMEDESFLNLNGEVYIKATSLGKYKPHSVEPEVMEEEAVLPKTADEGIKVPLKKSPFCLRCRKVFMTVEGYVNHCQKIHVGKKEEITVPDVKESVVKDDERQPTFEYDDIGIDVPVDFLEQQPRSRKAKSKDLRLDSNSENSNDQSMLSQLNHQKALHLARSTNG